MRFTRTIMASAVGILALLTAGTADAAHECRRAVYAEYDANLRHLNREFEAQKRALHAQHRNDRGCVLEEIRHVERTLCGEARAEVLRELHLKLQQIDRRHHRRMRALHRNVNQQRDDLRCQRDTALLSCRARCTSASHAYGSRSHYSAIRSGGSHPDYPHHPRGAVRPAQQQQLGRSPLHWLLRDLVASQL